MNRPGVLTGIATAASACLAPAPVSATPGMDSLLAEYHDDLLHGTGAIARFLNIPETRVLILMRKRGLPHAGEAAQATASRMAVRAWCRRLAAPAGRRGT